MRNIFLNNFTAAHYYHFDVHGRLTALTLVMSASMRASLTFIICFCVWYRKVFIHAKSRDFSLYAFHDFTSFRVISHHYTLWNKRLYLGLKEMSISRLFLLCSWIPLFFPIVLEHSTEHGLKKKKLGSKSILRPLLSPILSTTCRLHSTFHCILLAEGSRNFNFQQRARHGRSIILESGRRIFQFGFCRTTVAATVIGDY